ncbi:MAG: peptidase inhibitor family I36 protein [Aeromicrobium sp.]
MNTSKKVLAARLASAAMFVALGSIPAVANASGASTNSLSSCPSGYLCLWSGTSYTGTIQKFSSTGSYHAITLPTTGSLYNNRTKRSNVYEGSGGSGVWACFNPGAKNAALSGWLTSAGSVYLSTSTNC